MKKETQVMKGILCGLLGISLIMLLYYIFNFSKMFFNSDSAAVILLAKEQLKTGQFFPDNFCYSTGVFVFSLAIFIAPLMLFIEDWLLCREIAVLCFVLIIFTLIFLLYKKYQLIKSRNTSITQTESK